MRLKTIYPFFLLLIFLTGCFERNTQIHLNADGSGILEINTLLSKAFLRYAQTQAGLPPDRIWFHEQALRHSESQFGEGVRYLDHSTEELEGQKQFLVRYAFEDIGNLMLDIDMNAPFLFRPPSTGAGEAPPRFLFERDEELIRIVPPNLTPPRGASPHVRIESARARAQRREQFERERTNLIARGNPFGISSRATPEEILKRLGQDMRLRLELNTPDSLVSSNARYVAEDKDNRRRVITLFSFNGNEFIQSDEAVSRLAERGSGAFEWHDLPDLPGVKIDTGEIIQIRF